jgi:hypothetical protein
MTMEGVARSASLIKAVKNVCSKIHKLEMDKANNAELAFLELGVKQYGFDTFSKAVLVENERRYKEVQITGPNQWCEYVRATLEKLGFGNIYSASEYYEKTPESVVLPEDLAQQFAYLFVATGECKLTAHDTAVEPVIRARKLNSDDFKPNGRYEGLIVLKMREVAERLRTKQLSCPTLVQSVKTHFPELFSVSLDAEQRK